MTGAESEPGNVVGVALGDALGRGDGGALRGGVGGALRGPQMESTPK